MKITKNTTHLLLVYKSQKITMLFRASDGVALGQQKNETVVFGEEPNKKSSRTFFDQGYAERFLLSLANFDVQARLNKATLVNEVNGPGLEPGIMASHPVDILTTDGEGLIIMPEDTMEIGGAMGLPRVMKQ